MPPVADLLARRDALITEYTGLLRQLGRIPQGSRLPAMVTAFRSAGVPATGGGATRITRPSPTTSFFRDPATSTIGAPALASLGPVGQTLGALTSGAQIAHGVLAPDLPLPARALEAASGAAGLTRIGADIPQVAQFIPGLTTRIPLPTSPGEIPGATILAPGSLATALPYVGPVLGMAGGAVQGGERGALTAGASMASLVLTAAGFPEFAWIPQALALVGGSFLGGKKKQGPPIAPAQESIPGLRSIEGVLTNAAQRGGLPHPGGTTTIGGRVIQHPLAGSVTEGGTLIPVPGTTFAELAPAYARAVERIPVPLPESQALSDIQRNAALGRLLTEETARLSLPSRRLTAAIARIPDDVIVQRDEFGNITNMVSALSSGA